MKLGDWYKDGSAYLDRCTTLMRCREIVDYELDHICFECESHDSFVEVREMLVSAEAQILHTAEISGRDISIIRLKHPISVTNGGSTYQISTLELSDQKPDDSQEEGFDHIEIRRDGDADGLVQEFLSKDIGVIPNDKPHHSTRDVEWVGCRIKITATSILENVEKEKAGK